MWGHQSSGARAPELWCPLSSWLIVSIANTTIVCSKNMTIVCNAKTTLSVRKIGGTRVLVPGHQNSGAPTFFFGVFLMVFSHLCWQCSDKTRKCQEHINTLKKKEKLIFLKPILDIKTKTCWSSWKGTKVLVPPAFLAGLSWKNMPTNAGNVSIKPGNIRNTIVCLAKKVNLTYLIPIFNIYNNTGAERAPEFWCPLFLHG